MANDPNSIRLGACRVRWGGRNLGLTKGGVDVTIKAETKPIDVDQFGKTIVQEYVLGRNVMIKAPFAETDLDTLYALTSTSGGLMTDGGTRASGTLTFASSPTAGDTLTIQGHVFTFVTIRTATDQIIIGTTVTQSVFNTVRVLQSSSDSKLTQLSFQASGSTVLVSNFKTGVIGNAVTVAKTGTAVTASGATLTGGVDSVAPRFVSTTSGFGIGLYKTSLPLVLHPVDRDDNDFSEDFIVPLANTPGSVQFAYKVDAERIFTVDFQGFVDQSSKVLFTYGDTGLY